MPHAIGTIVFDPQTKSRKVILRVTARDIARGVNAPKPGLYGFSGKWHGDDALSINSYGKINSSVGRPVAKISGILPNRFSKI